MQEEFPNFSDEEQLKAENDFLKMKLMLERGGTFGTNQNEELPPEIENQFLNNIMAFEKQFEERNVIKVFDKIGKPQHFKPVSEIADADIDKAWKELDNYMREQGINLDVCSPNISARELYRFATQELFEHETDDMNLPGWSTNFIYDEFYPDPVYDNSRLVQQDLFHDIFRKEDLFYEIHYANDGFAFNNQQFNDYKKYSKKINRFKAAFDEIELTECIVADCHVSESNCNVTGNYNAVARTGDSETVFEGSFTVKLIISELGYWDMKEITITGFNP